MLFTRLAGGSTSSSAFSQCCPASTSANSGPHFGHTRAWARKLTSRAPDNFPSSRSVSKASNSWHCIPFWLSPGITSPAYRYVGVAGLVPLFPYLFLTLRSLRGPSARSRSLGSPYPVNPVESPPPAVPARASGGLGGQRPGPPGFALGRPGQDPCPQSSRLAAVPLRAL